ncbi:CDP-alcohol phosphatidyltransferase-domain-containing protein [Mycena belliarum]|uniref:diacylglycerol cholinephosphotransferase n=1 Tax=Mycena belliarum TaxID=1033014 RepID=A0AAD6U2H1_9AGAR|nr:CDP-alcohol phosphatidyltransferase-domain-containing protein [Mycena belliae]
MGYIPAAALQNLKKYSYKGVDKSVLSKYVLNPFWNWFVTLWPLSVAPNTITFLGLCIVFLNFMTMIYYDPAYLTEKGGVVLPRWAYFSWSIGLFLYQSFDAIDGKQARRTGMAGPLGEMFDHGCDAINTTLEAILACHALNLGRSWWTVVSQMATLANFYLTTWEEYHTGQLYLGVFSGPVEGILMIVGIYAISGTYGPSFWDTGVLTFLHLTDAPLANKLPDLPLNDLFMVFAACGLGFNVLSSYRNVRRAMITSNKSTTWPILLLMPFVASAGIQMFWLMHPRYDDSAIINSTLFVPFLCAWGLQFAHQVGRMILAHVTSSRFPWWDWMWVWSLVAAIDANLPLLAGRAPLMQTSAANRAVVVYLTLAISLAAYVRFCTLVIHDITNFMGIACFTVRKRDKDGVWQDTTPAADGKKKV